MPILAVPGRNCWRRVRADRLAVLVDAADYYRALRAALLSARDQILMIGWEFASATRLDHQPGAPRPNTVRDLLDQVVAGTPGLAAHVLIWDTSLLYMFDREVLVRLKMGCLTRPRLQFHFDDSHPLGASHHQKIVVVDDSVAFVGGLDVAPKRWDTRAHAEHDDRRIDPWGRPYRPFHDVQAMVSGEAAAALGELARRRWRDATGRRLTAPPPNPAAWPAAVTPDLADVPVALARTSPAWQGEPALREVETLFRDMIEAARDFIYIENQYFASRRIADAIAARLAEPDPPEMVVVTSAQASGRIEQSAMGLSRARLCERLRQIDAHGRLHLYHPASGAAAIKVHAKVMIVDDRMMRVGSANLNNRSMGVDTECDLLLEADSEAARDFVRALRFDLLAEHLGRAPAEVEAWWRRGGGMAAAIAALTGGPRQLLPLRDPRPEPAASAATPLDPEAPMESAVLAAGPWPPFAAQMLAMAATLVVLAGLATGWQWAPLPGWANPLALAEAIRGLRADPLAALHVPALFALATLVNVPLFLLMVVTASLFGLGPGLAYSATGVAASALLSYGIGRALGRDRVRRLAGRRVHRVSRALARHGVFAVIMLRLVPVAPFTVANLTAGAARLPLPDYLLGTALGSAPALLGLSLFGDRLTEVLRSPDPLTVAELAAWTVLLVGAGLSLAGRLARGVPAATPAKGDVAGD